MKSQNLLNNVILLQSYYKFLYLWKYLENEIRTKDFSKEVKDVDIKTSEKSRFVVKSKMAKNILEWIYNNPDKKNVFGYLVEISAFRGIMWSMKELMDTEPVFQRFLKKKLKDNYFSFEQIVKLIRNVLSHAVTPSINLKTTDFVYQKDFIVKSLKNPIDLKFNYADYFAEWKWSKEYGLNIFIDFKKLKDWQSLFDIIPLHQLYMLAELCYNITEVFKSKVK